MLLTTIEEMSRVHPALIRPGRCLAATEFTEFSPTEASHWLGRDVGRPMTLAELLQDRGDLAMIGHAEETASTGQFL